MSQNNEELKRKIKIYKLTNEQISEMTGYAIDTVKAWRVKPGAKKYRPMPDRAMKLLIFEIKDRNMKQTS
ncbi:MAG: hypothetical protein N0E44_02770 [Candidatus Thiodiazotropha lotti]|nr:hypothetical protein [Candidatus Thiodiazotropha lotti]MCW4218798.1 hypothetical protein [Candidatus Thiodiazotropha lotti]